MNQHSVEKQYSMKSLIRYITLVAIFFAAGTSVARATGGEIAGESVVINGVKYTYSFADDRAFNKLTWQVVNGTIVDSTFSARSGTASVIWPEEGTGVIRVKDGAVIIAILDVTIICATPTVSISAPAVASPGAEVTLRASGANTQTYSWSGPGLQSTSGKVVTAILPTTSPASYTVTAHNGSCTATSSAQIRVESVNAGPDRSICMSQSSIDLNSWGLSLSEGAWSGPGISGNTINLSGLAVGNHTYRYTRTFDGDYDELVLTINNSVGGTSSIKDQVIGCSVVSGNLLLENHRGSIVRWERSVDGGANYSPISSTANPYPFSEARSTRLRAVVKDGVCGEAFSTPVDVAPVQPRASSVTPSVSSNECDLYKGTVTLNPGYQGDRFLWQKNDGDGWKTIEGEAGTSISFEITKTTSFRAGVSYAVSTCPADFTTGVEVTMVKPKSGTLTINYSRFQCDVVEGGLGVIDFQGDKITWEQNQGSGWQSAGQSGTTLQFNLTSRIQYRAKVEWTTSTCAGVYTPPIEVGPPAPKGGNLAPSAINITCGRSTGILNLQSFWGNKITWQVNTGSGYRDLVAGASSTYQFDVTQASTFRAKVENTNAQCPADYSDEYTVYTNSVGGTTTSPAGLSGVRFCSTGAASLNLEGHVGTVKYWEHSTNGANWYRINGSEGKLPYSFSTSAPTNFYRAVVQFRDCDVAYSSAFQVYIDSPPTPGVVRFVSETSEVISDGKYKFDVKFSLLNYSGQLNQWLGEDADGFTNYNDSSNPVTIPGLVRTTSISALVGNGACSALRSGEAVFVINKDYLGVQKLLGIDLNEYLGYSYEVAREASLKDGFQFIANSAQEFHILLNDAYAVPPSDQNYVLAESVQAEGKKELDQVLFLDPVRKKSAYTYIDGIGRPMMSIGRRSSPNQKDLVVPISYDEFGRTTTEYLPYEASESTGSFKPTAIPDQALFYLNDQDPEVVESSAPYAEKVIEASPLNRVREQGAPGEDWQPGTGRTVKMSERVNTAGEVTLWRVSASGLPVTDNSYQPGMLFVNITTDEQGLKTLEYSTRNGLTVLKRVESTSGVLETFYIYDDYDRLRFVIQPEGVSRLNGGNPDATFLNKWAFQYKYDQRHRMIEKRVPGADPVVMVYDQRDRLVLSQDGNRRADNQWLFTKYDGLNRPVVTGIYQHTGNASQQDMAGLISKTSFEETYTGDGDLFGYTSDVWPDNVSRLDVHTVTFYDSYAFAVSYGGQFNYDKDALEGLPVKEFDYPRGQLTGTLTKVLDGGNTYLKTVSYYDERGRLVQGVGDNFVGGTDRVSNVYDFVGRVKQTQLVHTTAQESHTIAEEFDYDHEGRLLAHYHKLDNGPKVQMSQHDYNAIGELTEKNLHHASAGFLQSVDYRYNIRGWLTHINNAGLTNDGGVTNDEANDLFGFEIMYNYPASSGGAAQYNGNISEVQWAKAGDDRQSYVYAYDGFNRLKEARYSYFGSPAKNNGYNERITGYDKNGNILGLERYGDPVPGVYSRIDQLTYNYGNNGNQLMAVTDSEGDAGFSDGNKSGNDYRYDANGNMIADLNKDIDEIEYNYLNLPAVVKKKNGDKITYIYDAAGMKLAQLVESKDEDKRTDYSGAFVYEGDLDDTQLQFIQTAEGRIVKEGSKFVYQYHMKDHLGNSRLTFTSTTVTDVYSASYEDEDLATEARVFAPSLNNLVRQQGAIYNATPYGNYSQRLSAGGTNEIVGLAKSLRVMPGDTINMEVFAKYATPNNISSQGNQVLALTSAFGVAGAVDGIASQAKDALTEFILTTSEQPSPDAPNAGLTFILFDENFQLDDWGYVQVTDAAHFTGDLSQPHERLSRQAIVTKPGYAYIYLSNFNDKRVDVYFDDLKIEHRKGLVVQGDDYYPFGLAFNSYTSGIENLFKFNGKEVVKETGWIDYGARMYLSQIGRWGGIDPLAENSINISPFHYANNSPVTNVDLDGMDWFYYKKEGAKDASWNWHEGSTYDLNYSYIDKEGNKVNGTQSLTGVRAVVVFEGYTKELLGTKVGHEAGSSDKSNQYMNGEGTINAKVTVYGPGGANDVATYDGYTNSSNSSSFGVVADGIYDVRYVTPGKSGSLESNFWLSGNNGDGRVPARFGKNPAHPERTPGYLTGVYIHSHNNDGWAGTWNSGGTSHGVSEGCLLIGRPQWSDFKDQLNGVQDFKVQIIRQLHPRTVHEFSKRFLPLSGYRER